MSKNRRKITIRDLWKNYLLSCGDPIFATGTTMRGWVSGYCDRAEKTKKGGLRCRKRNSVIILLILHKKEETIKIERAKTAEKWGKVS